MQWGGNWLTYARPTNFHRFFRRKILLPGEVASDFIEVTTARKQEIEAEEAEFREPDSLLLEEAERIGATYDPATGFFVMNGLEDLSERDVRDILVYAPLYTKAINLDPTKGYFYAVRSRTLPKLDVNRGGGESSGAYMFASSKLEVLVFNCTYNDMAAYKHGFTDLKKMFSWNSRLRTLKGLAIGGDAEFSYTFEFCSLLEELEIINANRDIDLSYSRLLSAESVEFIVEWRHEKDKFKYDDQIDRRPFTIALHPDAYARIPEDLFEKALESDITIVEKRN